MDKARLRKLTEQVAAMQATQGGAGGDAAEWWLGTMALVTEKGAKEAGDTLPPGLAERFAQTDPAEDWQALSPAERSRLQRVQTGQGFQFKVGEVLMPRRPASRPVEDAPLFAWAAWYWPSFDRYWCMAGGLGDIVLMPQKLSLEEWTERHARPLQGR